MKADADARDPWMLVIAVSIANAAGMMPSSIPAFLIGGLIDDLGFSEVEAGALATLEIGAVAVTALLAAPLMLRLSALRLARTGLLLAGACQLISILPDSFWTLAALRLAAGVGAGLVLAGATATVAAAREPDRIYGYSIAGFMALTIILIPVLARVIELAGIDGGYGLLGAFDLLMLPLASSLARASRESVLASYFAQTLTRRQVSIVLLGMVLFGLGPAPVWAFMERVGVDIGMDVGGVGVVYSLGVAVGLVSSLLAGSIGGRWGRTRPTLLMLGVMGVACLGFGYVQSEASYVFMVVFFFGIYMLILPFLLATVAAYDPSGRVGAAAVGAFQLFTALGATVGGVLLETGSYATLAWFGMIVCCLTGLHFATLGRFLDAAPSLQEGKEHASAPGR